MATAAMGVVYVLTTHIPEDELWNSLEAKYMAEDASSKKFLVSNFTNYKMTDSRPVMEQYNELIRILGRFTQHKMNMDEAIQIRRRKHPMGTHETWPYFGLTLEEASHAVGGARACARVSHLYNRSHNRTTGKTPFEVVNGSNPITPIELTPLTTQKYLSSAGDDYAQQIQKLHEQVRERIEKQNTKYKERVNKRRKQVIFKEGDLVWIRLGKERFPAGRFGKLQPRADGPFRVLKRINDNAYKIELPGEYNVSVTFNVADLSPYVTDEEGIELEETENVQQDSRTNPFLAGEYDGIQEYSDINITWDN
ncbi:RNA-directed DNA polymerase [Tanacetum coccineum]